MTKYSSIFPKNKTTYSILIFDNAVSSGEDLYKHTEADIQKTSGSDYRKRTVTGFRSTDDLGNLKMKIVGISRFWCDKTSVLLNITR